ncbi:MAG: FecR family protein [Pseudobacter sp.]|uniref:FecR family protein n=1 Tax=Pseudobacter sp. TaxID=2045420 RepID=UPI003F7F0C13
MNQDAHQNSDINQLAKKYFEGIATEEEIAALHRWYEEADETDAAIVEATPAQFEDMGASMLQHLKMKLEAGRMEAPIRRAGFNWKYIAAAMVTLVIGAGGLWLYNRNEQPKTEQQPIATVADHPPGGDGAILTLSNNQQFNLDELKDGVVMKEKGVEIVKNGNEVSYVIAPQATGVVGFNTISTARGQKFRITLPDGSVASLDAASSLQFPASFEGNERKVFVTGQVYLDVAQNSKKPFVVSANGFQVNVLGTKFNINAYPDDPIKYVTLLQGSVQMTDDKGTVARKLVPGNQGRLGAGGELSVVPQADLEVVMAWHEGAFQFRDTEIRQVLTQLSRWYQVDVEIRLKDEARYFTGRISRSSSLNAVLEILRLSDINFKLEGNKLIVLP